MSQHDQALMKRGLITLGILIFGLLTLCVITSGVTGAVSWWLFKPEEESRLIQVVPVAPLPTVARSSPQGGAQGPAESSAPVPPPPSELEKTLSGEEEATSGLPEPEVEEALGFSLPAGSVNSVTRKGVATRLVIPRLDLDAPVVLSPIENQTWRVDDLAQMVGHLEGTAPPGSASNIVLAGHVTLAEGVYGPFAGLGQLTAGDELIVYEGDQPFVYVVDGYQTVERTAVEVTYPSETGEITLITCNNWNREAGRYEQRLIVKGHLVND